MATLIAVYDSDGCRGRCDARCYNAKRPKCTCICRGMNHGKGLAAAQENTRRHADELYDHLHPPNAHDVEAVYVYRGAEQPALFAGPAEPEADAAAGTFT